MKKFFAILLAAAMVFSLAACGSNSKAGNAEDRGRDVVIGLDMTNLTTLDVWYSDWNETFELSDAVFDRLFDKNPDTLELELNLLADWPTISDDGLTYTCKLRDDVKWSDGEPLTAKDVEFTCNYFYSKSENTWISETIQGSEEVENGEAETVSGFKLIDDYTFEITLKEPYSAFEATLATSMMPVLPAHLRTEYEEIGRAHV